MKPLKSYFDKPMVNPMDMIKNCVHCGEQLTPVAWNLSYVNLADLKAEGERYYNIGLEQLGRLGDKAKWESKGLYEYNSQKHGTNIIWRLPSCTCEGAQSVKLTPAERDKLYNDFLLKSKLSREILYRIDDNGKVVVGDDGKPIIANFDHRLAAKNCSNALRFIDITHSYISQIKRRGRNLLWVCGDKGMGKTLLAVLTAHAIMKKQLWNTLYIEWVGTSDIFNKSGVDSSGYLNDIKRATLLCVDDLERSQITKNGVEKLYNIINHRYLSRLPTIIVSRMTPEELNNYYRSFNGFNGADNTYICKTGGDTIDRMTDVSWNYATLEWRGSSLRGVARNEQVDTLQVLHDSELKRLIAAKTKSEWDKACDDVRKLRGGEYPTDWYKKVIESGFERDKLARFEAGR